MATVARRTKESEVPATAVTEHGSYDQLPLKAIAPSPKNARKEFDKKELEGLAATIREAGIVQPLVVRPVSAIDSGEEFRAISGPGVLYELVAGERRWRAAAIAGLAHVPAIIRKLDDRQAMLARALENYQRKELNAIEEASEFALLCEAVEKGGAGYTQQKLADELGCTQGHIANRIRLLELPETWRKRVISGEMSAGAAREILRATTQPAMAQAFDAFVKDDLKYRRMETVEDWKSEVDRFLTVMLKPMHGKHWSHRGYNQVSIFRPTEEEREQLQIVTVTIKGKEEERAINIKLWEKLQEKHEDALADKKDAKGANKTAGKAAKPTPAEEKRKSKERAEQFAKRLQTFKVDWLRLLVAKRLAGNHAAMTRLVLYAIAGGSVAGPGWDARRGFRELFAHATPGTKRKADDWGYDPWCDVKECSERKLSELSRDFVASWFVDRDGEPQQTVPANVVEDLAAELSIDLAEEWRSHKCPGSA